MLIDIIKYLIRCTYQFFNIAVELAVVDFLIQFNYVVKASGAVFNELLLQF